MKDHSMTSMDMRSQDIPPDEIFVSRDRSGLQWRDEDRSQTLSAERLRLACRCAWCTRDRLTDRFPDAFDVTIAGVASIGGHGLHITFSDGHARGIFPFRYLREIACAEVAA